MGAEFLVASLWVAVLVYWFWARRPLGGDTIGLFRKSLRVLEYAGPNRVAPANTLCLREVAASPGAARPRPALPSGVGPAAAAFKEAELRRRRRDVLCVICAFVGVTLVAAGLTRSPAAIAVQSLCDVVLIGYVALLMRLRSANRYSFARPGPSMAYMSPERWDAVMGTGMVAAPPLRSQLASAPLLLPNPVRSAVDPRWEPADATPGPAEHFEPTVHFGLAEGEHLEPAGPAEPYIELRSDPTPRRGLATLPWALEPAESYGDFESYESLALASR